MKEDGKGCGQYGEDRILGLVFRDQEEGLVVDVGAADGYWNSNSIGLLHRPGWQGVLIEPEPSQFKQLQSMYPNRLGVICVNCAIGMEEGIKTLYCGGQVSTFKDGVMESAIANHDVKYTLAQVPVRRLTPLLLELEEQMDIKRDIDFLSIDAEGMDYEVWRTLDTNVFSPKLVCIEGKKYIMPGYKELCRTAGNTFYLREDLCDLL